MNGQTSGKEDSQSWSQLSRRSSTVIESTPSRTLRLLFLPRLPVSDARKSKQLEGRRFSEETFFFSSSPFYQQLVREYGRDSTSLNSLRVHVFKVRSIIEHVMTEVVDSLNCCNFVRGNNITCKNLLGLICKVSVSTGSKACLFQKYFSFTG